MVWCSTVRRMNPSTIWTGATGYTRRRSRSRQIAALNLVAEPRIAHDELCQELVQAGLKDVLGPAIGQLGVKLPGLTVAFGPAAVELGQVVQLGIDLYHAGD